MCQNMKIFISFNSLKDLLLICFTLVKPRGILFSNGWFKHFLIFSRTKIIKLNWTLQWFVVVPECVYCNKNNWIKTEALALRNKQFPTLHFSEFSWKNWKPLILISSYIYIYIKANMIWIQICMFWPAPLASDITKHLYHLSGHLCCQIPSSAPVQEAGPTNGLCCSKFSLFIYSPSKIMTRYPCFSETHRIIQVGRSLWSAPA